MLYTEFRLPAPTWPPEPVTKSSAGIQRQQDTQGLLAARLAPGLSRDTCYQRNKAENDRVGPLCACTTQLHTETHDDKSSVAPLAWTSSGQIKTSQLTSVFKGQLQKSGFEMGAWPTHRAVGKGGIRCS